MSVYLDHAATTPMDPAVWEAMTPYASEIYANPHAGHQHGRQARKAVERARQNLAERLQCEPGELVFTSGGTEGDNHAIRGILTNPLNDHARRVLVTSSIEHHAVLHAGEHVKYRGVELRYVSVDETGRVTPEALAETLESIQDADQILVSLMHTNNEIGIVNPIAELAQVAHDHGALFHTDAVQSAGKLKLDLSTMDVDLLCVSAHKFYGPKGTGFLYVKDGVHPYSLMQGGSQERNRRGGTLNVPGIVGLEKAFQLMDDHRNERLDHVTKLRRGLWQKLQAIPEFNFSLNGAPIDAAPDHANPYILNVGVSDSEGTPLDASLLLTQLDLEGISVASGSACTAGTVEPSHVLKGLGQTDEQASAGLRFSFGKDNTDKDIVAAVAALERVLAKSTA
jgi:cysteine desulfurase